ARGMGNRADMVNNHIQGTQVIVVEVGFICLLNAVTLLGVTGFYRIDRTGNIPLPFHYATALHFNALNITQIMRDRGDQAFGVRSFPAATVRAVMEGCGCCTFGDSNGLIVATVSNGSTGTTRLVTIVVVTIIAITSGRSHRMGSFTGVGIGSHAGFAGDITQSVIFHILLAGAQAAVS